MNAGNRSRITEFGDEPGKLYDEASDVKTGIGCATRDVSPYNGVKIMKQPKGRL